jgi:hypothetical protein
MNLRKLVLSVALIGTLSMGAFGADEAPKVTTKPPKPATCALNPGSHIRPRIENGCEAPKPFRSYTQEDLQRTGEIDLNEALRKLDPIFR